MIIMQMKINYSKSGSSQFVYELPGNKFIKIM